MEDARTSLAGSSRCRSEVQRSEEKEAMGKGEGRERRIHPKTHGWERQTHVVKKGFPVPPLLLPPVLQVEEEITKREDVDGVWTEKDDQGRRKRRSQMMKQNCDWTNFHRIIFYQSNSCLR
jgi:hypothetical protein